MPNNYVLLETIALTQSAASVTFDNLPTSGYTDLKIVVSARGDVVSQYVNNRITFNGSTSGYSSKLLYGLGSGSGASANNGVTNAIDYSSYGAGSTATANTFGNTEIYIPNYRSSNNKSVSVDGVTENNATLAIVAMTAGLWSNTAAITSIAITPDGGSSFVANSTFSLYGIAALGTTPVLAPKATGGNIVANDGTFWYHAFTSSGNFVPQTNLTADILVVAGGGAGFGYGGGGAGGIRTYTAQSLAPTLQTVTVGAGGPYSATSDGNLSQFAALASATGGGGAGRNGGSGGGGADSPTAGGTGITGQGNNGGTGTGASGFAAGGGGGGAGAVGANAGGIRSAGAGGIGSTTSLINAMAVATSTGQLSGGNYYFAGGAGGGNYVDSGTPNAGAGGLGGGGSGGARQINTTFATATPGSPNTGGGGGGAPGNQPGREGGSGIVIIRYPIA
jgi:hypothetical protein